MHARDTEYPDVGTSIAMSPSHEFAPNGTKVQWR